MCIDSPYKVLMRLKVCVCLVLIFTSYRLIATDTLFYDIKYLTSEKLAGREAGSIKPNLAAVYLYNRFNEIGLKTTYQQFKFKSGFFSQSSGHNVVARLGCSSKNCRKTLIITAHYDHLGKSSHKFFPGANDNASGVAALLNIAKVLKTKPRSLNIVFVATDAEEKGLHGAKYFASKLNTDAYVGNINLDMLAINQSNTLYFLYSKKAKHLLPSTSLRRPSFKIKQVGSRYKMRRLVGNNNIDWHRASDHYAFYRVGIPYVYIGMGEDVLHHTTKDTLQAMNFKKYEEVVTYLTDYIVNLSF